MEKKLNEQRKTLLAVNNKNLELQDENCSLKHQLEKINSIKDSTIMTLIEKLNKLEVEQNDIRATR
jgi:hypothetical protein